MNFFDNYDITSPRGSTPPPNQPQQSLNEEVNQVIGQISRMWMGFRKQSQTVFETARRDFGDVVTQAQRELITTAEETRPSSTTPAVSSTATFNDADVNTVASTSAEPSGPSSSQSVWNTQALFSRLQAALPPNVVSTVQSHIPESIKHASENIDLTQIRTNLLSEVQRIQGVTRAQAEEYVHKSEALLREAVKEAQEVLKDAVKVIPPEETASTSSRFIQDRSDMSPEDAEVTRSAVVDAVVSSGKGKGEKVGAGVSAAGTRAGAFLTRLRHDPTIMRTDPESDRATKELYTTWIQKEVTSKKGGLEGEEWQTIIAKNLDDTANGQALMNLKETVVPSDMTEIEFWQRFFFRSHQIKEEEEKRKAVLQVNTENEDDFDWDDEDSGDDKDAIKQVTPTRTSGPTVIESSNQAPSYSAVSTRESSLDSFDVVSSANASSLGETTRQLNKVVTKHQDKGGEGEEEGKEAEGGGEEGEEKEDDSDWE